MSNQTMATTQMRPMAINTSADRGSTTRRQLSNLAQLLVNLPSSEEPLPRASASAAHSVSRFSENSAAYAADPPANEEVTAADDGLRKRQQRAAGEHIQ